MSRITLALALTIAAAGPLAAQQTMTPEVGFRFYVAPTAQVTQLNGETAVLTGVEFGWLKTDRLTLGIAVLLAGVNSALLAVLAAVWLDNYREFGSTLLLGLVGFSAVLLIENLVSIAFFFSSMRTLYAMDPLVGRVVLAMSVLELLAVSLLTYATVR